MASPALDSVPTSTLTSWLGHPRFPCLAWGMHTLDLRTLEQHLRSAGRVPVVQPDDAVVQS